MSQPSAFGLLQKQITALQREQARRVGGHPPWQKGCRVYRSTAQSIAHNTLTALSFDTQVYDTDDCWVSSSPTRLTAKHAGYYLAGGQITMAMGATYGAEVLCVILVNGTNWKAAQQQNVAAGKSVGLAVTTGMIWLSVDDYIEIYARQIQDVASAAVNLLQATATYQQFNNGWLARIA
jgi:hypothetical protein